MQELKQLNDLKKNKCNFCEHGSDNSFSIMTKKQSNQRRIRSNIIKIKIFWDSMDATQQVKKNSYNCKKKFANIRNE